MKRLAFIVSLLLAALPLLAGTAAAEPRFVRVSWDQPDTAHTVAIAWNTDSADDPTMVEYGTTTSYGLEAQGTAVQVAGDIKAVHEVSLADLTPDTLYHYRVGGPGNWSVDHTFRTGPEDLCAPFRFAACGDGRSDLEQGASMHWKPILSEVHAKEPAFVLLTGDQVKSGEEHEQWAQFLDRTYGDGPGVPLMMTLGNHDTGGPEGDGAFHNQTFVHPRNSTTNTEDYYYFTYGDAIFVSLSTVTFEGGTIPFQEQADWLDQVLEDNPRRWKIVFFHHPPYTGGIGIPDLFEMITHPSNEKDQNGALVPILDKHHVDLVLNGHNHFYQRFEPMCCGGDDDKGVVVDDAADGTVYVITGGAGAMSYDLTPIGIDISWVLCLKEGSAVCDGRHHYVTVDIDQNSLHYQVWTTASQLLGSNPDNVEMIDELWITKDEPPPECAVAPPEPTPDTGPDPAPDPDPDPPAPPEEAGPTVEEPTPPEPDAVADAPVAEPAVDAGQDEGTAPGPDPEPPGPGTDGGGTPSTDGGGTTPLVDTGAPTDKPGGNTSDGCRQTPTPRGGLLLLALALLALAAAGGRRWGRGRP